MGRVLAQMLSDAGRLSPGALQRAINLVEETGEPLHRVLARLGLLSEKDLTAFVSERCGVDILSSAELPRTRLADNPLSPLFLKKYGILPLRYEEDAFCVAMPDPSDEEALEAIRFVIDKPLRLYTATSSDIEDALRQNYEELNPQSNVEMFDIGDAVQDREDAEQVRDLTSDAPVISLVNRWVTQAADQNVSDIHIEPGKNGLQVRFRIDGALVDVDTQPRALLAAVSSRIKIMGGLDIGEKRLAQDGRFSLPVRGRAIDIRVSIVPTVEGESIVLRLLDRASVELDFEALGIKGHDLRRYQETLAAPHGIVLVTGPTGSGKTTTLYTSLLHLQKPDSKILTVEDPVEYRLAGIMQSQVQSGIGMGFANLLRSFLRHDPDVIMVGEIRDTETARIAVQAALTGHVVLSTLHTNDAVGAIMRLLDMGVEDYLIPSTLNAVLAQRLVRRLCPTCRTPYEPPAELVRRFDLEALNGKAPVRLYKASGCDVCRNTGMRGRLAIYELLTMTSELRALTLGGANGDSLREAAKRGGMVPIQQNGIAAALQGETTLDEVLRVTREV